jgi:hypothetical protein
VYERRWNSISSIISRASIKDDDNFGKGLVLVSKSEQAKAEFLLQSIPSFYGSTVENIRAKDYEFEGVSRKLREYIPARQKRRRIQQKPVGTENNLLLQ